MKLILGVAGEIASGKGTFAAYVKKKYGGNSFSFSEILKNILDCVCLEKNRRNIQGISTVLRKNFGEDVLAKAIYGKVKASKNKYLVVDGVRRMADIKFLKKEKSFKLIYLEADIEKKFSRIRERNEKTDDQNKILNSFKKDHLQEAESQIKGLKKHADYIIENNGTKKEFYREIDKVFKSKK